MDHFNALYLCIYKLYISGLANVCFRLCKGVEIHKHNLFCSNFTEKSTQTYDLLY